MQKLTKQFMWAVIILGMVCLGFAVANAPLARIDFRFLFLAAVTVGLGSRITIQIPKFKSHIAVSDTFIFLALMLFGGELAIILAALEAFCSSWRFCNKKITVFFNASTMAVSTAMVVAALHAFGIDTEAELHGHATNDFIQTVSIIALVQFFGNSGLASIYGALKTEQPWWETWKTHYLWTFVTYSIGAVGAGVGDHPMEGVGIILAHAAIPAVADAFEDMIRGPLHPRLVAVEQG